MATVLYGRARGYGMAVVAILGCALIEQFITLDFPLTAIYTSFVVFSVLITEAVLRHWRPARSLIIIGTLFISLIGICGLAHLTVNKTTLMAETTTFVASQIKVLEEAKKAGHFSQDLADLGLARPVADIAQEAISTIPGYLFMGVFFLLWVNMYLVLKGRRLLQPGHKHAYDENALLNFKMPLAGVYVVAIGLALAIWGQEVSPLWGEAMGLLLLRSIGVFYFFQGFGVALVFLNHFQIVGFFRTLFVMAVVFFVPWMVALLGLFDTWFDFNQKLKKKVTNFKEPL